jgi:hypothetical protein
MLNVEPDEGVLRPSAERRLWESPEETDPSGIATSRENADPVLATLIRPFELAMLKRPPELAMLVRVDALWVLILRDHAVGGLDVDR